MRSLTAILLILICPGAMSGQAVFRSLNVVTVVPVHSPVYETGCADPAPSGSTSTCSMTLAGGEAVAIYLQYVNGTSVGTVTDSTGQPIVNAVSVAYTATAHMSLSYIQNATAGPHTILVTMSAAGAYQVAAVAYTGAATTGALLDGTPTSLAFAAASNPFSCPAITTTQSNGVLIGGAAESSGSIALNAGTGFTMRQKPSPEQGIEEKSTTVPGSYSASFITTTTTAAGCVSMVFKHA